jgi:hypothetical protein
MLVLIIGGRYGSSVSEVPDKKQLDEVLKSITKKEYETARDKDIPVYIFVEKVVMAEYQTYKENKKNNSIVYAHVYSVGVFLLLDEIFNQGRNNLTKEFDKFDDISAWLTDQWAGLFADFLSKKSSESTLRNLTSQVEELKQLSGVLKSYNESIIRKLEPEASSQIITDSDEKLRRSKINRFAREPMIRYLINHSGTKKLLSSTLYNALEDSNSLKDFLTKAKIPIKYRNEFLEEHSGAAQRDYEEFIKKYLNYTDDENGGVNF